MNTIERFPSELPVPFSKAVRAGGFFFLSGVLAIDAKGAIIEGGIQAQTQVVLERIAKALADCGGSLRDVVRVTTWLADFDEFGAFNAEYAKHFAGAFPARSTVQAGLHKGARVEIEVQAWFDEQPSTPH